MSELSETLGHLLCEITRARMAADRESVRIARQYAEDDGGLLRHFPVPRMRMPQLELTLPVVVSHIPQGYVAKVAPDMLVSALSANLKEALKGLAIHVSTTEIRKIVRADANLSQGLVSDQLPTLLTEQLHDHTRRLVERLAPKPGTGPSEKVREQGWYRVETYTTTSTGARYVATMSQSGDPGYKATAAMLGECGLALALDRDKLPELFGVLTPAAAMGDALLDRFPAAGISLDSARLN